jgi:hypothetical protein
MTSTLRLRRKQGRATLRPHVPGRGPVGSEKQRAMLSAAMRRSEELVPEQGEWAATAARHGGLADGRRAHPECGHRLQMLRLVKLERLVQLAWNGDRDIQIRIAPNAREAGNGLNEETDFSCINETK